MSSLIDQVKRKLDITWSDEDTDRRLKDIIDSASPILQHKLGIADKSYDFSLPGIENNLFLAYCLYEWNHTANEFDINYANEIAQCQAKNEVAYYKSLESGGDAGAE